MVGHVKHSILFYLNKKKMLTKYIGQKYFNLAHKEDFYKSNYVPKIYISMIPNSHLMMANRKLYYL